MRSSSSMPMGSSDGDDSRHIASDRDVYPFPSANPGPVGAGRRPYRAVDTGPMRRDPGIATRRTMAGRVAGVSTLLEDCNEEAGAPGEPGGVVTGRDGSTGGSTAGTGPKQRPAVLRAL